VVTYAPNPVTDATADLALFLLLGTLRQANPALTVLRSGVLKNGVGFGHDPQGKVLGVLGMGRMGRALKRRAEPFGMTVVYHNRRRLKTDEEDGARYVSFGELLGDSDAISVHVPLNKGTHYLIGAPKIAKMKKGVVIFNNSTCCCY
jgi:glyoxylate reductase